MEGYTIWTKHGEEGDNIADYQGGDDESIPDIGGVNRVEVVNEETSVKREVVVNDVFWNMLADNTMEDAISKICKVWR